MTDMPAQAIILAAGRGERLRPWTDTVPKPLLSVGRHRLIEWHLHAMARAGLTDVVVNTAWLEEQFPAALGDGSRYGLRIHWSFEQRDCGGALETAGGIARALPLLAPTFWVASADVYVPGFAFEARAREQFERSTEWARLWLTGNAAHHPEGDFGIDTRGMASRHAQPRWTWASVGLFRAEMFESLKAGDRLPLRPLLDEAASAGRLGGQLLTTGWIDVGTPDRWQAAQRLAADVSA
jgi:MurNAc alpha-1-phosphate uridylyltransferase